MTHQRDIESLINTWLGEGSTVAPDRVIDVVTDRIERQRQRGAWRFPRREFQMPALLRIAAVAAAIAVFGASAIYFAGSPRPSIAQQSPDPSPTASASASPSPCPRFPSTIPEQTPQSLSWTEPRPGIRLDLPAGWQPTTAECPGPLYLSLIYGTDPNLGGLATIRANPVLGSNAESCQPAKGVGSSVTAIVSALLVDPRLAVAAGPAITVDGRPAQVLDVQLAPGFTGTCQPSDGQPRALLFSGPGSLIGLTGNQRVRVILLDVVDVPMLILVSPMEEAYDDFVARSMALIDGVTFLP